MAIAIGGTVTSSATTGSPAASLTFAHTCATGSVLFVGVTQDNVAGDPSVTYNGVAMTKAVSLSSSINTSIWYLTTPTTGSSQNVVITYAGSSFGTGGAIDFTGVNTSSPIGVTGTNLGSSTAVSTSVTTTTANSWLLDTFYLNDRSRTATVNGSQVQQWNADTGTAEGTRGEGSTLVTTTTGSYTMGWTLSATSVWKQVVVEIIPSGGAPTVNSGFFYFAMK